MMHPVIVQRISRAVQAARRGELIVFKSQAHESGGHCVVWQQSGRRHVIAVSYSQGRMHELLMEVELEFQKQLDESLLAEQTSDVALRETGREGVRIRLAVSPTPQTH